MNFPLDHPPGLIWSRTYDRLLQTRLDYDLTSRVLNKMRKIRNGFLGRALGALVRWASAPLSLFRHQTAPIYEKKDA